MAKKKRDEGGGGESWMNTYADMVTLLLTFFVMLFSMSTIQEDKWKMLLQAFTQYQSDEADQVVLAVNSDGEHIAEANQGIKPPGEGDSITLDDLPADFDELYQYLKSYVEDNGMQSSVEVGKADGRVYIRFRDNIFFDGDRAVIKQEGTEVLTFLGDCLKSVEDQILFIHINGHTADVNNPNYPVSDRKLSSERADNVAIFLEDQMQLDPKLLFAVGNGKNWPVDDNNTEEGRQHNRRVDLTIVGKEDADLNDQKVLDILRGTYDDSIYPEEGGLEDIMLPQTSSMPGGGTGEIDPGAGTAGAEGEPSGTGQPDAQGQPAAPVQPEAPPETQLDPTTPTELMPNG